MYKLKKVVELIIDGTVIFSLKGVTSIYLINWLISSYIDVDSSPDPTLWVAATAVFILRSRSKPAKWSCMIIDNNKVINLFIRGRM